MSARPPVTTSSAGEHGVALTVRCRPVPAAGPHGDLDRRRSAGSGSTSTGTPSVLRGSPTHSKCMPSGTRKLPPHAKLCLRKMRTTRQSICGMQPCALATVFMSNAMPHAWRLTEPICADATRVARVRSSRRRCWCWPTSIAARRGRPRTTSCSAACRSSTISRWQLRPDADVLVSSTRWMLAATQSGSMVDAARRR